MSKQKHIDNIIEETLNKLNMLMFEHEMATTDHKIRRRTEGDIIQLITDSIEKSAGLKNDKN